MNFNLKEKFGPLPVWAWGTIVGLVLVAGIFMYRKNSSSSVSNTAVRGAAIDPQGYQTAGIAGGTAKPESSTKTTPVYPSNSQWLNTASKDVASYLGGSPSAIYAALRKYVTGESLTTQEKTYVDAAITRSGNPPEGTYGVSDVNNSATTPKPIQSLGIWFVNPGAGGQPGVFELYNDNSKRWISPGEYQVLNERGTPLAGTKTMAEFANWNIGRSDDPA